jgi:uncharacterized membrane protein YtjA (UPF0391 family)
MAAQRRLRRWLALRAGTGVSTMYGLAMTLAVIALIAAILGFGGLAGALGNLALIIFVIALIGTVIFAVLGWKLAKKVID